MIRSLDLHLAEYPRPIVQVDNLCFDMLGKEELTAHHAQLIYEAGIGLLKLAKLEDGAGSRCLLVRLLDSLTPTLPIHEIETLSTDDLMQIVGWWTQQKDAVMPPAAGRA